MCLFHNEIDIFSVNQFWPLYVQSHLGIEWDMNQLFDQVVKVHNEYLLHIKEKGPTSLSFLIYFKLYVFPYIICDHFAYIMYTES